MKGRKGKSQRFYGKEVLRVERGVFESESRRVVAKELYEPWKGVPAGKIFSYGKVRWLLVVRAPEENVGAHLHLAAPITDRILVGENFGSVLACGAVIEEEAHGMRG